MRYSTLLCLPFRPFEQGALQADHLEGTKTVNDIPANRD
jgi:hypothetical protein